MSEGADPQNYLFEKMFFQAAHIAILEEALTTVRSDLLAIAREHTIDITSELVKIDVAYQSIDKLKKGIML